MLSFLRKYQRFFFIITTVVIVLVFSFFGTYNGRNLVQQEINKRKIKQINGKVEVGEGLIKFLELEYSKDANVPNLLSDGVIIKDFLNTDLAHVLVEKYFHVIKKDLQERMDKIKKYSFYVHPQVKEISQKKVYELISPPLSEAIKALEREKEVSFSTFDKLAKVYLYQLGTAEFVRRVLYSQQEKLKPEQIDFNGLQRDFSLYQFKSLQDWFGQNFIDLIGQFILNTAAISKEKGNVVTDEEAYFDLTYNFQQNFQKVQNEDVKDRWHNYFKNYF